MFNITVGYKYSNCVTFNARVKKSVFIAFNTKTYIPLSFAYLSVFKFNSGISDGVVLCPEDTDLSI